MEKLGMPQILIEFKSRATAAKKANAGVAALILRDESVTDIARLMTFSLEKQVSASALSEENKAHILAALKGGPGKVLCSVGPVLSEGGSDGSATESGSGGTSTEGGSDGSSTEGGSDGSSTEGGSDGSSTEGGSDGSSTEGGSDGSSTEGGSDGSSTEGGSDGSSTEGGSDGSSTEGGSDGSTTEGSQGATLAELAAPLAKKGYDVATMPGMTDAETAAFIEWAKEQYDEYKTRALFLVANADAPNHPAIVNFCTDDIKLLDVEGKVSAADYLARVAGVIAGMPLSQAITYHVLEDVEDCPNISDAEADALVGEGKLLLYNDGEKVKIARGVNSFVNPAPGKPWSDEWRKIRTVKALNRFARDIQMVIADGYIGRVANSYINKLQLLSAINDYLAEMAAAEVLDTGAVNEVAIDMDKQLAYISEKMGDDEIATLTEQAIKEANTGDKVFLAGNVRFLDAMEDVELVLAL